MQTPRPVPHDPAANLVVYSAAFKPFCQALLAGFAQAHPGVRLQFIDAVSTELHTQYLSLHQSGQALPDVIWSSAMDLQMDLVRLGHARPHRSASTQALPNGARYQDLAFCTTLEPLVSLRHSGFLGPPDAISTLQEIADLMQQRPDLLRQRIACLDIEANGMGFLAMLVARAQDPGYARFMDLAAGMGLQRHGANPPLVQALVSERAVLAFPVLGAFAARALASHPQLAVCTSPAPRLGVSRVALIPKAAPHPDNAACFVDFLLSSEGQHCMRQDGLFPWQDQGLSEGLPILAVQALPIDDGFAAWLDPQARSALRHDWAQLLLA